MKRLFQIVQESNVDEIGIIWELGFLIWQVHNLLKQGNDQVLADYPITIDGYAFLSVVKALGEDATQAELARWMMRRHTSIITMVQRLHRKGYIRKKKLAKTNDKTYIVIELTNEGQQILAELEAKSDFHPKVLSTLSFEEMGQLRDLLFRLRSTAVREIKNYEEPPYPSPNRPFVASWEGNGKK